jgi:hypothetical protein
MNIVYLCTYTYIHINQALKMSSWQDQVTDGANSSYSGTVFQSNDHDAIDLSFSDYESEYVPSETSVDREFVVPDTDALSYVSDKSTEEENGYCSLQVGIVEDN